jgi:hypothetical protein
VNTEEAARIAADNALSSALAAETAAREAALAALNTSSNAALTGAIATINAKDAAQDLSIAAIEQALNLIFNTIRMETYPDSGVYFDYTGSVQDF